MTIDQLSGRQLDIAVARQVFGHQVEERPNARTRELDAVYNGGLDANAPTWVRVPIYSISLAASTEVELELQKQGWKRQEVRSGSHWKEPGGLRVILEQWTAARSGRSVRRTRRCADSAQGGGALGRDRSRQSRPRAVGQGRPHCPRKRDSLAGHPLHRGPMKIEDAFAQSWDWIEQFYRDDLLSQATWRWIGTMPSLISGLRQRGYDRALRAGQSLFILVLSRSREHGLVVALASQINGCAFCIDLALAVAIREHLGMEKFNALSEYRTSPLFSDRERAALAYVEEATRHKRVSDTTFDSLRKHFSEWEIVEITWLKALENYYNLILLPLAIDSDGFCAIAQARIA